MCLKLFKTKLRLAHEHNQDFSKKYINKKLLTYFVLLILSFASILQ